MKAKICPILLAMMILLSAFTFSGCKGNGTVTIKDKDGNVMAKLTSINIVSDGTSDKFAYIEEVLQDAVEMISAQDKISLEKAEKKLFKEDAVINTAFDSKVFESIITAFENSDVRYTHFGCAVVDTDGNVRAVYSATPQEYVNYATTKLSPHSSFKPLSVYSQALEKDIINWSSVYEDSPYKLLRDVNGNTSDWPQNASLYYSYMNTGISEAIKVSLNTIAVKCLNDVGVSESVEFMMDNFGFSLDTELELAKTRGDDEVIGNIALGSLYTGVSPLEMAGAYGIFATGGVYSKPCTITDICSTSGEVLYHTEKNPKNVISKDTAYIMNKLLQKVTENGATGVDAYISEGVVAGKTGTGETNEGNWFVGVIPGYSCAVWHGGGLDLNYSPQLFREIMTPFVDESKKYPVAENVEEAIYCTESGMLKGENCTLIDKGYYKSGTIPKVCDMH